MDRAKNRAKVKIGNLPNGSIVNWASSEKGPICIIAEDDRDLEEILSLITFIAPRRSVEIFPAWDTRPFDRISPHKNIAAKRASTLAKLANGDCDILLTSQNAIAQKVPTSAIMRESALEIKLGHILNLDGLHKFSLNSGYNLVPVVRAAGEYAVRGGIVDIFPAGFDRPVRIDLFGDVIDNMRFFDPDIQRSQEKAQNFILTSPSELILNEESTSRFRDRYRNLVGVPSKDDPFYEAVSAGIRPQGVEQFLPLFYEEMTSLFAYLPKEACLYFRENWADKVDHRFEDISLQYQRSQDERFAVRLNPAEFYLTSEAIEAATSQFRTYECIFGSITTGVNAINAGALLPKNFTRERNDPNIDLFEAFLTYVELKSAENPVVIACATAGSLARMRDIFLESGTSYVPDIESLSEALNHRLTLAVLPLRSGYEVNGYTLISEADVLGDRLGRKRRAKKSADNVLSEATSLGIGDLTVHREHGIGRFSGMQTLNIGAAPHECLVIEYQGGDKLFVPVENIEVLAPYAESGGTVDKLGASAWQERKARTKKNLLAIAEGLIKLAAERDLRKAPVIKITEQEYNNFSARFPYTETDDQILAIEETLNDLSSGKVMDRLVCGDVGFGKTEVAIRAAFATAMSGFQVALIAPTTLLARQHARNFSERFHGTGIRISHLSRFVSRSEVKLRKEAISKGQIDIVVGTHALLANDVKFKNLGLLIIDEEQHFGVKHKEKIKELRSDVHVLTLSATPIPRTLQLALSGVRELSLIATPPVDRLAVRTYVAPFERQMIRDALFREKQRGGQSFYVVPRVSDLPEIEEFLSETCPDMRVITAHGQLPAGELDQRVNDFYDQKADILLATTIVESGLDIPTANTLIVHRADMFGLAQLYQIRGRVGRSKVRAYAYLTTKVRKVLNPAAEKRLRVLSQLDELGSGFNLASHDLDLRGAGNLLGEEQSGQIREVGFALYQSMLKDAITALKAGDLSLHDRSDQLSPEISLGVAVMIPEDFVSDLDTRLSLYRRLARLRKKDEIDDFTEELIDRFGPLPDEIYTLFKIVRIKAFARVAGISNLDAGARGATIKFFQNRFKNPKGLVEFISNEHGNAKVKDTRIIVFRNWENEQSRIAGALKLVAELAKIARDKPKEH